MGVVVRDIAIGAEGIGFETRASQIGHCRKRLATDATCQCCPDVSREDGVRHSYHAQAYYCEYNEDLILSPV